MANKKETSPSVASKASKILRDNRYSSTSKSVAGSLVADQNRQKEKVNILPTEQGVAAPCSDIFYSKHETHIKIRQNIL